MLQRSAVIACGHIGRQQDQGAAHDDGDALRTAAPERLRLVTFTGWRSGREVPPAELARFHAQMPTKYSPRQPVAAVARAG